MGVESVTNVVKTEEWLQLPLHCFVLQAIDPVLGCPVLEAMLRVVDPEPLRPLLVANASEDAELRDNYVLDPSEVRAITERFGVAFDPGGRECWLSRVHSIRGAPCLVHTGYELALMLDGVKPFAKLSGEYPAEPDGFPETLFEPYVQAGLLVKRVVNDPPFGRPIRLRDGRVVAGTRQVLYARPGEEWRIDAYLLIQRQIEHGPWNDTLERLEGSLLGYTDPQNDWWIARRRRDHAAWVASTAYAAVTAAELAWVRAAGERSLSLDGAGAALEVVLHGTRPEPGAFQEWMADAGAAAIIRFGLSRDFLHGRKYGQRGDARRYAIECNEIPALNRALASVIEVIAERGTTEAGSPLLG